MRHRTAARGSTTLRGTERLPDGVRLERGRGSLDRLVLAAREGEAHGYLHGAHAAHLQPKGERPVLWMSAESRFEGGRPIRGGVPICFPWFGARCPSAGSRVWGASTKTAAMARTPGEAAPIAIAGETDRVYTGVASGVTIEDPAGQRRLVVAKTGSATKGAMDDAVTPAPGATSQRSSSIWCCWASGRS